MRTLAHFTALAAIAVMWIGCSFVISLLLPEPSCESAEFLNNLASFVGGFFGMYACIFTFGFGLMFIRISKYKLERFTFWIHNKIRRKKKEPTLLEIVDDYERILRSSYWRRHRYSHQGQYHLPPIESMRAEWERAIGQKPPQQ